MQESVNEHWRVDLSGLPFRGKIEIKIMKDVK